MADVLVLTQASSGAPTLNGVNGSLCTVLDWALVQKGWAIEYSSGNARVYRPGSGNRFRLHVNHDSAVSGAAQRAVVRGCENASSATVLTDPFPQVAQIADTSSQWLVSTTASATARDYYIHVWETGVRFASNADGTVNSYSLGGFYDLEGIEAGDTWATAIFQRNVANNNVLSSSFVGATVATSSYVFLARDITGATKSTRGQFYGSGTNGTNLGAVPNAPVARAGYQNTIDREKVGVTCIGSSTTTPGVLAMLKRGWIPNFWNPLHSGTGTLNVADTHTDTAYNPSAVFRPIISSATCWYIEEETDTWSPPSG